MTAPSLLIGPRDIVILSGAKNLSSLLTAPCPLLLIHQRPRFPQFRKEALVERSAQIRRATTAAGPHTRTNRTLDHLNMPQSPRHQQFIKFRQTLTYVDPVAVTSLIAIECSNSEGAGTRPDLFRCLRIAGWDRTKCGKCGEEDVAQ